MPPEVQAILFALACGVIMTIYAAWEPITRKVFPVSAACGRLLRALATRYLNLPELRRIMSTNEQNEGADQDIAVASQSATTKNDEVTTKKEERDDVDIMIHNAVYRAQVETTAKILHFARQQNKKLPETRILEDIFKVSSGSNKKWYSVHGDVMRELAKYAPPEPEPSAKRLIHVGSGRMTLPENATEKDKDWLRENDPATLQRLNLTANEQKIVEQAQEKYGDQIDEKQPESEKTDEDDELTFKPLLA